MGHPVHRPIQALQGRDPFSGDCDAFFASKFTRVPRLSCRDETRFQGIATGHSGWGGCRALGQAQLAGTRPVFRGLRPRTIRGAGGFWICWLAGTRPVFRGLRRRASFVAQPHARGSLQGRDPFSGDCDIAPSTWYPPLFEILQGRDPFSGDCDPVAAVVPFDPQVRALQGRDPFSGDCDRGLCGPPPGGGDLRLQGRDPFSGDCDPERRGPKAPGGDHLAGTRPVFRGLRLITRLPRSRQARPGLQGRDPFSGDCDTASIPPEAWAALAACRDETRFQGIATRDQ